MQQRRDSGVTSVAEFGVRLSSLEMTLNKLTLICRSPICKEKILSYLKHLPSINSLDNDQKLPDVLTCDDNYFQQLQTIYLGRAILYSPLMNSTQTFLLDNALNLEEGIVCIADEQTQGLGRGSNSWESPQGCLTFSFKSNFLVGSNLPFVQYLVSLAIVKAVKCNPDFTSVDLRIKWPNDIYGNQVKVGGVLCRSDYQNGKFGVITGIGLNMTNTHPTTCINEILKKATSNKITPLTKTRFLVNFFNIFEKMQIQFNKEGFQPFRQDYFDNWMHSDQEVVIEGNGNEADMAAVIKGLTPSGLLYAVNNAGEAFELSPDGNSLDFFKGLIKRKL